MTLAIHKIGYARPLARIKAQSQLDALAEHGIPRSRVYVEGDGPETLEALIGALRKNDVVYVVRLHFLAAPKAKRMDRPRLSLWSAVRGIEAAKASIFEIETGRSTLNQGERDAMIEEAIEQITHSGRSPRKRDLPGRPPKVFSDDVIDAARRVWENRKIVTWGEVAEKLPKGFALHRAYKMFGARGSAKEVEQSTPQHVYFVRAGRSKRVKIGTTANIHGRLRGIKHPLIGGLRLLGYVDGGYAKENEMHRRFAEYRIKGEWFRLEGELEKFIGTLKTTKK
jgi:hypothetical protein